MKIKGRAVKSITFFVKRNFPEKYDEWLNSLSPESRRIIRKPQAESWHPLKEALIEPTEKVCEVFYDGDKKGAWELGRYSAEMGLRTELEIDLKYTPVELLEHAEIILPWYYPESEMELVEKGEKSAALHMTDFSEPNEIIEMRIGGWLEKAVEMVGGEKVTVELKKSLAKGDPVTEYIITWD